MPCCRLCRCAAGGADAALRLSQLRRIEAYALPPGTLARLQPFSALTSLSMQGLSDDRDHYVEEAAALGRLTSLQHLVLNTASSDLLPGTSALTNLTSLSLGQLVAEKGVPRLQHLPPQLQELTMTLFLMPYVAKPVVDLSHVTNLTRLVAVPGDGSSGLEVVPGVALPANLAHLAVADVLSVQALLQLPLLRLELHNCWNTDLERMLQLSSLTSLSYLQVLLINAEQLDLTADALPRLSSLRGLQVGRWLGSVSYVGAPALRTLQQLTALQSLRLQRLQLPDSSSCRVADVVRAMSGLQHLGIAECVVGSGSAAWAGVGAAIAALPALRDVRLADISQWNEAASVALSAATQVTSLTVVGGELSSLVGLVHKLSGLGRLWIDPGACRAGGFDVDAAAASLKQLTQLCVCLAGGGDPLVQGFPGAAVGHSFGCIGDPLERTPWHVQWWSRDMETWEMD